MPEAIETAAGRRPGEILQERRCSGRKGSATIVEKLVSWV
jgi:hypothetical protein